VADSRSAVIVTGADTVSTSGDESESTDHGGYGRRGGSGASGGASAAAAGRMADTPSLGRFLRVEAGANAAVAVPPSRLVSAPSQASKWVKCRVFRVGPRRLRWDPSVDGTGDRDDGLDAVLEGLGRSLPPADREEAVKRVRRTLRWAAQVPGSGDRFVMVTEATARPAMIAACLVAPAASASCALAGSGVVVREAGAAGTASASAAAAEPVFSSVAWCPGGDEERAFVLAAPPGSQALRSLPPQDIPEAMTPSKADRAALTPTPSLQWLPAAAADPELAGAAATVAALRPFASLSRSGALAAVVSAALSAGAGADGRSDRPPSGADVHPWVLRLAGCQDCDERKALYSCGPGEGVMVPLAVRGDEVPGSAATRTTAGCGAATGGGALAVAAGLRQRQLLLVLAQDRCRAGASSRAAGSAPFVRRVRLVLPAVFGDGSRVVWCPRHPTMTHEAGASVRPPPSPRAPDLTRMGSDVAGLAAELAAADTRSAERASAGRAPLTVSVARSGTSSHRPLSSGSSLLPASPSAGTDASFATHGTSDGLPSPPFDDHRPVPAQLDGPEAPRAATVQRRMARLGAQGARRSRASSSAGDDASLPRPTSMSAESLAAAFVQGGPDSPASGQAVVVSSRLPSWSPPSDAAPKGSLALKFLGGSTRVRSASSRNFVFDVTDPSGRPRSVLQVGRLSRRGERGPVTAFSLDFRAPLAPAQGLATLLSSFAWGGE